MSPRRHARLIRCLLCGAGLVCGAPNGAQAQVVRVAVADRELARAEASMARGYRALPLTLLAPLATEVTTGRDVVVVRLFDDTLQFYPGYPSFRINERMESLHSWAYLDDGVLFVAQWFFTAWLPSRYPQRLRYQDGVLLLKAGAPATVTPAPLAVGVAGRGAPRSESTKRSAHPDTSSGGAAKRGAGAEQPPSDTVGLVPGDGAVGEQDPLPQPRQGVGDPLQGVLLGFIDARVSAVYESNVDRDPVPRPTFGTVARLGIGLQSARSRPFLTARYDLALHRYAATADLNRTAHDVAAELAPSFSAVRLRLGAALRIGSWTEDRQPADQIILRPQIEIRPTPIYVLSVYALHSSRRIAIGEQTRRDTFLLTGVGLYRWWRGGGVRVDGQYEMNGSEDERSRYRGGTAYTWIRFPLAATLHVTLQSALNQRRYPRSFVDPGGIVAREDRRWTSSLAITSAFARARWELGVAYAFEDNASNNAYARYRAHRAEFTIRRRW